MSESSPESLTPSPSSTRSIETASAPPVSSPFAQSPKSKALVMELVGVKLLRSTRTPLAGGSFTTHACGGGLSSHSGVAPVPAVPAEPPPPVAPQLSDPPVLAPEPPLPVLVPPDPPVDPQSQSLHLSPFDEQTWTPSQRPGPRQACVCPGSQDSGSPLSSLGLSPPPQPRSTEVRSRPSVLFFTTPRLTCSKRRGQFEAILLNSITSAPLAYSKHNYFVSVVPRAGESSHGTKA